MNLFLKRLRSATAPLVIAHRGASAIAPENTLAAAERAWAVGATAWEFDVHLTRDRVPVLIHDESLIRTTDVVEKFAGDPRVSDGAFVSQFDYEEIRTLDAGSWFLSEEARYRTARSFGTLATLSASDRDEFGSGTVRVPSLTEALALTVRRDWLANVEIKSFPNLSPALLELVMAEVDRQGASSRVLLSSFHHEDVARAGFWRPTLASGVLHDSPLHRTSAYVREIVQADCAHPSAEALGASSSTYREDPGPLRLRADVVRELRENQVPVLVYTVNDARPGGLASHLESIGVSALFTDVPEAILGMRSVAIPA